MIDLYRINLNLLVALDVLFTEKSVTQAAKKLHMTQAAMSNNLQQLREVFKDELLIREKNYMILTSYALSLQVNLRQILEEMRSLIMVGQRFEPLTAQRTFKIALSDYMSVLLMPKLLNFLEKNAPGIKLTIISYDNLFYPENFENVEYDFVISKLFESNQYLQRQFIFKDKPVCIMNTKHPLARKKILSLDDYLAYQHTAMRCGHPDIPMIIDEVLSTLGVQRDVKIYTAFMTVIFQLVQESQSLLGTVSERVAEFYQKQTDFIIKPLPFITRGIDFYLFWHQRYQNDLGHSWLREQLLRMVV